MAMGAVKGQEATLQVAMVCSGRRRPSPRFLPFFCPSTLRGGLVAASIGGRSTSVVAIATLSSADGESGLLEPVEFQLRQR